MKHGQKAYKGQVLYSKDKDTLVSRQDAYIIVEDGRVKRVCGQLPEDFPIENLVDWGQALIIPGFSDMHVHAPQFLQRGMGMDRELMDWLDTYTYPTEAKFKDPDYARAVYTAFADELLRQGTLQVNCLTSIHYDASDILFEILEARGLFAFTGKLNMDQKGSDYYIEETAQSLADTERFLEKHSAERLDAPSAGTSSTVVPSITPRFSITCSEELLAGLGVLSEKYNAPVHSHMCESINEMRIVKELFPAYKNGAEIFYKNNLLGQRPSIMAHCIFMDEDVLALMENDNCMAVHCPDATANINAGGIMPVKKLLERGIHLALGSDVGSGASLSIARGMATTIQHSKIRNMYESEWEAVNLAEAFYMATKSGGRYFDKVGSFEEGYYFNALVIDDSNMGGEGLMPEERLERFCYAGDDRNIIMRYLRGEGVKL